jgi:hypothetical protein
MGGALVVESAGINKGATFTLDLRTEEVVEQEAA